MKSFRYSLLTLSLAIAMTSKALATEAPKIGDKRSTSQMIRGGTGLIQTPTARMSKEGDFRRLSPGGLYACR